MENLFNLKKRVSYYPSMLRHLICAVLIFNAAGSYAQAPTLSYSTPKTYTQGTAITPLAPTSSGVASFAYNDTLVVTPSPGITAVQGIAFDVNRNLFVATGISNSTIEELPAGGGGAVAYGPVFDQPMAVATDINNNVYVADQAGHAVYKIPPGGGSAITLSTVIQNPSAIAVDRQGNVYVGDFTLGILWKLPATGGAFIWGKYGPSGLNGVAVDNNGNVYVAKVTSRANALIEIAAGGNTSVVISTRIDYPMGLAVDPAGNVFNSGFVYIGMFPAGGGSGTLYPAIVGPPGPVTGIYIPFSLTLDKYGSVYVGNSYDGKIRKVNRSGGYFISPNLPPGLNFDENTGTISGTPTVSTPPTNYVVTAYNSSGRTSTTIGITIAPISHVVDLVQLKSSAGVLSPTFSASTTSYTTTVVNGVRNLMLTPITASPLATVTINGIAVADSAVSTPIAVPAGTSTIFVGVTAPDGVTTKTYTLAVTRPGNSNDNLSSIKLSKGVLSPVFTAATTSYTATVVNGVTSIKITPTAADSDATVKVNGTTLASGTASAAIPLSTGANTISIATTSSDGTATKTDTLTVTRLMSSDDYLKYLNLSNGNDTMDPFFSYNVSSYTASVAASLRSMTVAPFLGSGDPDATITVNGASVASGASSPGIPLSVGSNTISVVVTAADGTTTRTYTVVVTRPSGPANSLDADVSVSKPTETPVLADDGILVHEAISPNGDGINDFLVIENIRQYPDNKLTIMNRIGQMIYEAKGYDNTSKVFDGHSNKNGQMQLPGTYFYQLDYTVSGITKHKTGYLVLKY